MPNVSKATASETVTVDGLEVSLENFDGGYTVCFESHTADADLTPIFRGLPGDRCQFPRWGYVVRGRVGFRRGAADAACSSVQQTFLINRRWLTRYRCGLTIPACRGD